MTENTNTNRRFQTSVLSFLVKEGRHIEGLNKLPKGMAFEIPANMDCSRLAFVTPDKVYTDVRMRPGMRLLKGRDTDVMYPADRGMIRVHFVQ